MGQPGCYASPLLSARRGTPWLTAPSGERIAAVHLQPAKGEEAVVPGRQTVPVTATVTSESRVLLHPPPALGCQGRLLGASREEVDVRVLREQERYLRMLVINVLTPFPPLL